MDGFKKLMLLDFSSIGHATYHAIKAQPYDSDEELVNHWKQIMLQSIRKNRQKHNPDDLIICCDGKSWRKKVFPYYKARRDANKAKEDMRYQFFLEHLNSFVEGMINHFAFRVMKINGAEADDLIGILSTELQPLYDKIIIASNDKDFRQLLNNKTHLWHIREEMFIEVKDPQEYLLFQILNGDSGDDVPNVRSDDDVFIDPNKRQKSCGAKTIDKILESGTLESWLDEEGVAEEKKENRRRNFKRNKKLIELSRNTIPSQLWDLTMTKYKEEWPKRGYMEMLKFMQEHSIRNMIAEIQTFI